MNSLDNLIVALNASWGHDTCFDSTEWSTSNPARGQCVSSSLIVQDYMGGDIVRYRVEVNDGFEMHYCNLVNGAIIDTTSMQYGKPVKMSLCPVKLRGYKSVREKRLSDMSTKKRYEILKRRVEKSLKKL